MADYFGYDVRDKLFPGEDDYFRKNPTVSGMAAEDNRIIFNPYSQGVNRDSVGRNEAARLWLREKSVVPKFNVSPEQLKAFQGTPYEKDELALKHTILARIISGDPSAGNITPMQRQWADWVLNNLKSRKQQR